MAGIGEFRPQVVIRPPNESQSIRPTGGNRQMPKRQPNRDNENKQEKDDDKDDPFHIDEYA